MHYLGIFGQELKTNYCHICLFALVSNSQLISILKFVYLQNFTKKQKCQNLGPKMPDLGIFGYSPKNSIAVFEISTLEFV